jgi:hypothetical protein
MGLRWSIPLPGPFRASGRVFSGRTTRSLKRAGRKLGQAATQPAAPARPVDYSGDIAAARERAADYEAAAAEQAQWRQDKAAGRTAADAALAERQIRQYGEWAVRQREAGMPGSAAQYERMAAELREQWPGVAAKLDGRAAEDAALAAKTAARQRRAAELDAMVKRWPRR